MWGTPQRSRRTVTGLCRPWAFRVPAITARPSIVSAETSGCAQEECRERTRKPSTQITFTRDFIRAHSSVTGKVPIRLVQLTRNDRQGKIKSINKSATAADCSHEPNTRIDCCEKSGDKPIAG